MNSAKVVRGTLISCKSLGYKVSRNLTGWDRFDLWRIKHLFYYVECSLNGNQDMFPASAQYLPIFAKVKLNIIYRYAQRLVLVIAIIVQTISYVWQDH